MAFNLFGRTWGQTKKETPLHKPRLSKGEKTRLVNRIIEQTKAMTKKDLDSWRSAMRTARNIKKPRRARLYQVFDDAQLDAKIFGLMEHSRKEKLFSEEFRITNTDGTVDEELTDLFLSADWFFKIRGLALDSKFWGHSLIEVGDVVPNERMVGVDLIPREHVVPETGEVLIKPTDATGIAYRDTPLMADLMEFGEHTDMGLLNRASILFIYKKNAMMAWAEYIEIFGMPIRIGKTQTRSTEELDRMEDMLKNLGTSAYGIFQEGETIEFIESTKGDAYNVYDKMIDRANQELSTLFLGQTMTTETSKNGSRAAAEVHERTGDGVLEADKRYDVHVVNDILFPFLTAKGWNMDGKKYGFQESKNLKKLWVRTLGMLPFFEVDIDWIKEKFGVEVTESKTELNFLNQQQQAPVDPDNTQKNKKMAKLAKMVKEYMEDHEH